MVKNFLLLVTQIFAHLRRPNRKTDFYTFWFLERQSPVTAFRLRIFAAKHSLKGREYAFSSQTCIKLTLTYLQNHNLLFTLLIKTKFSITTKITKYSSWVVPISMWSPFKKKYNNRHFSAMVQAIATKFGRKTLELTLNLWTLMAHGNLDFRIYDGRRELLKI